jgi:hypothetical protein
MTGAGYATPALPQRSGRSALLARVLGLYIAGAAGTIQLMDIVVDRAGLPDRVFAFVIVLAVMGLPITAAAALMLDIAAGERRTPRQIRPHSSESQSSTPAAPAIQGLADPSGMRAVAGDVADRSASLPQRLELALSYRRIALLHEAAGSADDARPHRERFRKDIARIADELRELTEE